MDGKAERVVLILVSWAIGTTAGVLLGALVFAPLLMKLFD